MLTSLMIMAAMTGPSELASTTNVEPSETQVVVAQSEQTEPKRVQPQRRRIQPREIQKQGTEIAPAAIVAQVSHDAFHDPNSVGWYSHRNLTNQQYSNLWNKYKDDGFIPIDIEMDVTARGLR